MAPGPQRGRSLRALKSNATHSASKTGTASRPVRLGDVECRRNRAHSHTESQKLLVNRDDRSGKVIEQHVLSGNQLIRNINYLPAGKAVCNPSRRKAWRRDAAGRRKGTRSLAYLSSSDSFSRALQLATAWPLFA